MSERTQITYMQTRICRKAAELWGMSLGEAVRLFHAVDVLGYIERNFGIFHMEGDDAVFDDVCTYLRSKGVEPRATLV